VDEGEDVLDEAAFLGDESAVSTPALPPATACLLLPSATLCSANSWSSRLA
jgi:hypothetical protein